MTQIVPSGVHKAPPPPSAGPARNRAAMLLALVALALPLGGCDKCLNFIWEKPNACRDHAPPRP